MKVGLYFGSFNPVHTGHLIIANYVQQHSDLDQVWLVVSPQNPLKKSNSLLNEYHRLFLVQIAIENEPHLRASDIEFRLPRPSYTINTLTYLDEKYPEHQFAVILGSDSFQNIAAWKNHKLIIEHYQLFIYERPGYTMSEHIGEKIKVFKAPLLEISSTYIRKTIREGKSVRYLVPDKVLEEIARNGYYRS